jgi:hypothetical protein
MRLLYPDVESPISTAAGKQSTILKATLNPSANASAIAVSAIVSTNSSVVRPCNYCGWAAEIVGGRTESYKIQERNSDSLGRP